MRKHVANGFIEKRGDRYIAFNTKEDVLCYGKSLDDCKMNLFSQYSAAIDKFIDIDFKKKLTTHNFAVYKRRSRTKKRMFQ